MYGSLFKNVKCSSTKPTISSYYEHNLKPNLTPCFKNGRIQTQILSENERYAYFCIL